MSYLRTLHFFISRSPFPHSFLFLCRSRRCHYLSAGISLEAPSPAGRAAANYSSVINAIVPLPSWSLPRMIPSVLIATRDSWRNTKTLIQSRRGSHCRSLTSVIPYPPSSPSSSLHLPLPQLPVATPTLPFRIHLDRTHRRATSIRWPFSRITSRG